ncbi:hypothetical protein SODALDRAFT_12234 [Sodiomyces alkalinus F11]|uniref:Uncharacterized protein n=1 Tax=Sodiomyces alkalinus (strain CBS 110278 / VKM F-3762 / F11) TaxID=1314773 RepID=A0A3N2Q688_SODAK|nr:hypothetical protein SODALDRAFT_12234 [Sodiomyces alkalinus F11]ROT42303.1 hypothetical protein SODALDRAFT_12234 [Sodiomyces alkalinus F11]
MNLVSLLFLFFTFVFPSCLFPIYFVSSLTKCSVLPLKRLGVPRFSYIFPSIASCIIICFQLPKPDVGLVDSERLFARFTRDQRVPWGGFFLPYNVPTSRSISPPIN